MRKKNRYLIRKIVASTGNCNDIASGGAALIFQTKKYDGTNQDVLKEAGFFESPPQSGKEVLQRGVRTYRSGITEDGKSFSYDPSINNSILKEGTKTFPGPGRKTLTGTFYYNPIRKLHYLQKGCVTFLNGDECYGEFEYSDETNQVELVDGLKKTAVGSEHGTFSYYETPNTFALDDGKKTVLPTGEARGKEEKGEFDWKEKCVELKQGTRTEWDLNSIDISKIEYFLMVRTVNRKCEPI